MASTTGRLTVAVVAVFVFFVFWAALAAHPWKSASPDPRLQAIAARRQALVRESALVNRLVAAHAAAVRSASAAKASAQATASAAPATTPAVRIVTLPPLTITRTS
jgi:hypothetical protein